MPTKLAERVDGAAAIRRQTKTVLYEEALATFFDPHAITAGLGTELHRDLCRLSEITGVSISDIAIAAIRAHVDSEKKAFGNQFAYQQSIPLGPHLR